MSIKQLSKLLLSGMLALSLLPNVSAQETTVKDLVLNEGAEGYEDSSQSQQIKIRKTVGEKVTDTDVREALKPLPEGVTFDYKGSLSTEEAGEREIEITVKYADGSVYRVYKVTLSINSEHNILGDIEEVSTTTVESTTTTSETTTQVSDITTQTEENTTTTVTVAPEITASIETTTQTESETKTGILAPEFSEITEHVVTTTTATTDTTTSTESTTTTTTASETTTTSQTTLETTATNTTTTETKKSTTNNNVKQLPQTGETMTYSIVGIAMIAIIAGSVLLFKKRQAN